MGWTNSHLHQFTIDGDDYSMPSHEDYLEYIDYRKIKLNQVVNRENQKFLYEYDFGDGWEHSLVLEKIGRDPNLFPQIPICLKGKRSRPPENCGGPFGYEELLEIVADPEHEEYHGMIEWLGDYFAPEEFDIDFINQQLKEKDFGCF